MNDNRQTYLERQLAKYKNDPVSITQRAILGMLDEITDLMEADKMSRADLARATGLAPAQVTRLLSGEHNLTLATLGKIASAFEADVDIRMAKRTAAAKFAPIVVWSPGSAPATPNPSKGETDDALSAAA